MAKKLTKQEFIEKALQVHGTKYNYDKVDYINNRTKVLIYCSKHGYFEQTPSKHLEGRGCPKCRCGSNQSFIEKAKQIHGDKYDYSKVRYQGRHSKIIIGCKIHGQFVQEVGNHLQGSGCPICAQENRNAKKRLTLEQFIQKASIVHNNKYNYSKSVYVNNSTKVDIICPIHGIFSQRADAHLSGQGCPKCKQSKGEQEIQKFLKEQNISFISQYAVSIDPSINPSGKAYVDFYLPQYNMFIEYNGQQHYIPIKHFGGDLQFEQQQERDNYIKNYCESNNIKLLEIRYDVENITTLLSDYIMQISSTRN